MSWAEWERRVVAAKGAKERVDALVAEMLEARQALPEPTLPGPNRRPYPKPA